MMKSVAGLALVALLVCVSADTGPVAPCDDGVMYVADQEDLCRFHWCIPGGQVVEMRCAPGARVPTWYTTSPSDSQVPCTIDHRPDTSCLRCETMEDEPATTDRDDCASNPCEDGCTCQDLWQSYHCLCPGDEVPVYTGPVDFPDENFCVPDPCQNGAKCHSQWDDYWCQCPHGFTGKNCEVNVCVPDPCMNGGTCMADEINYHCECTECYTGVCCNETRTDGVCAPTTAAPTTAPPTTAAPTTTLPPTEPTEPIEVICEDKCYYGSNCDQRKVWLCDCVCTNFADVCTDNAPGSGAVECGTDEETTAGTPFTVLFMENSNELPEKRALEVYVSNAGTSDVSVRVYTPLWDAGTECHFSETREIGPLSVATFVVTECLEHIGSGLNNRAIVAEETEGKNVIVYIANKEKWSADGALAIPDKSGGKYFVVGSYSPAEYAGEFAIVSLEDDNEVTFSLPPGVQADIPEGVFNMDKYESLQVQASLENKANDLSGTRIMCTKKCHAWGGNIRALITAGSVPISGKSRDHTVEQLMPVYKWGETFLLQPIPGRGVGDFVKLIGVERAEVSVITIDDDGDETVDNYILSSSNNYVAQFEIFSNERQMILSSVPIQVIHIVKSRAKGVEDYHDPALITIPSLSSFTNNFVLSTPLFSGGVSGSRPYNTSILMVIASEDIRDDIMVETNSQAAKSIAELNGMWTPMPDVQGVNYYSAYVMIAHGTSRVYHPDRSARFQAIFYAFDDRETLGFPLAIRFAEDNALEAKMF